MKSILALVIALATPAAFANWSDTDCTAKLNDGRTLKVTLGSRIDPDGQSSEQALTLAIDDQVLDYWSDSEIVNSIYEPFPDASIETAKNAQGTAKLFFPEQDPDGPLSFTIEFHTKLNQKKNSKSFVESIKPIPVTCAQN